MIASAYRYARGDEGAEEPGELRILRMVDRFGAQAVFGRPLRKSEMSAMIAAEDIVKAYWEMTASENMNDWIKDHPEMWKLFNHAEGLNHDK